MATYTWTGGAGDGLWQTATNWDLASGNPDGVDDDAVFSSGAVSCTGVDSAKTIGNLRIGSGYTGILGVTAGTAITVSGTTLDFSGGGAGHNIQGTWTNVDVNTSISSTLNALRMTDSTITTLTITGGDGTVFIDGGNLGLTTVNQIGAQSSKLILGIAGNGVASITNLTMDSGEITRYGVVSGEVTILGGVFKDYEGTTATMHIYDGTVEHKSSSTITTLVVYGGEFDGSTNTNASCTITNTTLYQGGEVDLTSGLENYTLTNGLVYNGGNFSPDKGTTWTIS